MSEPPVDPGSLTPLRDVKRFTRVFGPGEEIFAFGSRGGSMFVLVEGEVEIRSAQGSLLTVLSAGQMFGEIALVDAGLRTATAVAGREPTRLVEIDKARFIYLVGQQPAFALSVIRSMARRIQALSGEPFNGDRIP